MNYTRQSAHLSQRQATDIDTKHYPVKLGNYMAQWQASKQKQVLTRMRSAQLLFKHQTTIKNLEQKRESVMKLLQRLIDDLMKKKFSIQSKMMQELEQEEKVMEAILKMTHCNRKQKPLKDGAQTKQRTKQQRFQVKQQFSPIRHVLNQNGNSNKKKFQELVVSIPSFEEAKEKVLIPQQTFSERTKNEQNTSQITYKYMRKQSNLKNASSSILKLNPTSHQPSIPKPKPKLNSFEFKLQSKVKFRD